MSSDSRAGERLGPEVLIWRRVFPGGLDQAPAARRFVRFLLGDTPFAEDAELIVGELAGNALRHTRSGSAGGHFTVEVTLTPAPCRMPTRAAGVLLTVFDLGGGGSPCFGGPGAPYEENGRGLSIVHALATRAGHQGTPATGHRVWAYLSASGG
ncbi:ATP-binding protein [Sphaerisporangium aureirubrum]|uniref:ATP-binding protein n=1 Tax=Sphaerisporangium aureirubrum TaxID=1544736 RepID=A0ABW1NV88_9ACTN